jgi:hypothetical protein
MHKTNSVLASVCPLSHVTWFPYALQCAKNIFSELSGTIYSDSLVVLNANLSLCFNYILHCLLRSQYDLARILCIARNVMAVNK